LANLGFALTPVGVHPFGPATAWQCFANNFLELLAVTDAAAIPAAGPADSALLLTTRIFLAAAEGMSMLAWHSTDAHCPDAARFKANGDQRVSPIES